MHISLEQAANLLNQGEVVGVPTETVYGLAASLKHPNAIANIFKLKGRPSNNPLIVHISSSKNLKLYVKDLPLDFDLISQTFWPGPMTLVMNVTPDTIPEIVRANLPTAAFRIPSHPLTRKLLEMTGPLVMPSANLSTKPSSTTSSHVEEDFGKDFPVLDGGSCLNGVESTILIFQEGFWQIIRLGALPPEAFLPTLGYLPKVAHEMKEKPLCPGQMYRHYAPKATLLLIESARSLKEVEAIVGFEDRRYPSLRFFSLGNSKNPLLALQNLYAVLRKLDEEHILTAWVDMDFPNESYWLTLRERLLKSAKPPSYH